MSRLARPITLSGMLVLASCGGGSAPPPAVVYAAGWALESNVITAPVYWTSEVPTMLSRIDPACNGRAYGIASTDIDVHIVGYTSRCNGVVPQVTSAAWWTNAQRVDLPKPNDFNSVALDVVVASGSVYIAGAVSSSNGSLPVPVYWKDGASVALELPAGAEGGIAQGIAVNGQDVFVSVLFRAGDGFFVGYYRNGTLTRLPLPLARVPYAGPFRIAVANTEVYVSGSLQVLVGPGFGGSLGIAVYWKNGVLVQLSPENGLDYADAPGLALDAGHVYVAGWWRNLDLRSNRVTPVLWTDVVPETMALRNPDADDGVASAVRVVSGAVYVSGYAFDRSVNPNPDFFGTACYWRNGMRFDLKGLAYAGPPGTQDPHLELFGLGEHFARDPWIVPLWPDFGRDISVPDGVVPVNLFTRTPSANSVAWAIAIKP